VRHALGLAARSLYTGPSKGQCSGETSFAWQPVKAVSAASAGAAFPVQDELLDLIPSFVANSLSSLRAAVGRQQPAAGESTQSDCLSRRPRPARGSAPRDGPFPRALNRGRHRRYRCDDLRTSSGGDDCAQSGRRRIAGLSGSCCASRESGVLPLKESLTSRCACSFARQTSHRPTNWHRARLRAYARIGVAGL
jgi:hypothetical protein